MRKTTKFAFLTIVFVVVTCLGAGHPSRLGQDIDIGIIEKETIPADKGDVLIYVSATWCVPCQVMQPHWLWLKAEGYQIVKIDIDDPYKDNKDRLDLVNRCLYQYKEAGTTVPMIFWYNSQTDRFAKLKVGYTRLSELKDTLWKKSS